MREKWWFGEIKVNVWKIVCVVGYLVVLLNVIFGFCDG